MHNSKRIRRMIIAIALIIVILLGLDYILYPCTFMRNDIHTVTTQKHQDIFMGTSHGKMNIDPKTISSVTGRTGHNLCVGGEYGIDAYYLAKLLLEKQNESFMKWIPGTLRLKKKKEIIICSFIISFQSLFLKPNILEICCWIVIFGVHCFLGMSIHYPMKYNRYQKQFPKSGTEITVCQI